MIFTNAVENASASALLAIALFASSVATAQQPIFRAEPERVPTEVRLGHLLVVQDDDGREIQVVQVVVMDQSGEAMRQQVVPLEAVLKTPEVRNAWDAWKSAVLAIARREILKDGKARPTP